MILCFFFFFLTSLALHWCTNSATTRASRWQQCRVKQGRELVLIPVRLCTTGSIIMFNRRSKTSFQDHVAVSVLEELDST